MKAELELLRLNTGRESMVSTFVTRSSSYLFKYGGYIGAYLIVAGYDSNGPHLCQVTANGLLIN
jgi:20S proteasome alpha/beta subunit